MSIFTSKVAKRMFVLFLLCALFPIVFFSILSFTQVSSQLKEQSRARLQSMAKAYGLFVLERFALLQSDMDLFESIILPSLKAGKRLGESHPYNERMQRHFKGVIHVAGPDEVHSLIGDIEPLPDDLMGYLSTPPTSKPMVLIERADGPNARVFFVNLFPNAEGGLLVAEVNTTYLWGVGTENILPPMTKVCILDTARHVLFGAFEIPEQILLQVRFDSDSVETRSLAFTNDGQGYFVSYWPLFLKSKFEGPNLIVLLGTPHSDVFAPLSSFKILFSLVALLAFLGALLTSAISIRKSMVPLEKLKEGALRLARKDFDTRVNVTSGDEFQAVAETLNDSAAHLGRQFHAMETMAEIDRAILSTLSRKQIVEDSLKRISSFFSCEAICIGLIQPRQARTFHVFGYLSEGPGKLTDEFLTLEAGTNEQISTRTEAFFLEPAGPPPAFVPEAIRRITGYFLVLPLFLNKAFSGLMCLGHRSAYPYTDDDVAHAKRLANQVSAALANAYLVDELELLNWGTLEALARTVDAKSKWTAGHSERVTELSVKIATVMGCDDKSIDALHRAAFLHDIGKIGISLLILDKPDKLTADEYKRVQEHPIIGAKILEPIEAYADIIPIIIQHHEHFDGNGYPYGIAGEALTLEARILSVADVYDALVSNRPYRQGWVEDKVIQTIVDESGKQFDPKVVDAFLAAISWSDRRTPHRTV